MILGDKKIIGEINNLAKMDPSFQILVDSVVDLGLLGRENTRSHVTHALGTVQVFLSKYPIHKATIQQSSKSQSFPIMDHPQILTDWISFIQAENGPFGPENCYDYTIQKNVLPRNLGGNVTGGGGGGDEFKKVLRLLAEII